MLEWTGSSEGPEEQWQGDRPLISGSPPSWLSLRAARGLDETWRGFICQFSGAKKGPASWLRPSRVSLTISATWAPSGARTGPVSSHKGTASIPTLPCHSPGQWPPLASLRASTPRDRAPGCPRTGFLQVIEPGGNTAGARPPLCLPDLQVGKDAPKGHALNTSSVHGPRTRQPWGATPKGS